MTEPAWFAALADEQLLTQREVAEALRVHPKTVYRMWKRGQLAVVRTPGGLFRYRWGAVRVFLEPKLMVDEEVEGVEGVGEDDEVTPASFNAARFANRLNTARVGREIRSWVQVAEEAVVDSGTLYRVLSGKTNMSVTSLVRLLVWLGETDMDPYIKDGGR